MNKGDAGIVITMVQQLKKVFDNPHIIICSLYPELDKGKYGEDVEVIAPPIRPLQSGTKVKRLFHNLWSFLRLRKALKLKKSKIDFIEKLDSVDLVLSCGGGFMQCRSIKEFFSDFIYHYAQLESVRLKNKKYFIFAQTVGPFCDFAKKAITKIMNNANAVLARENISFNYVKKNYPSARLFGTADIAFLLGKKTFPIELPNDKIKIGITVRKWIFPGVANREKAQNNYINAFVNFLKLPQNKQYEFYLMPQVIGPGDDNDLVYSQIISDKVNLMNVHVIKKDLDPREVKYIYSKMDYFIGTRMHSNIFSLSEYVPCLAISYDYKTDGIMRMAGQDNYLIKIEKLNSKILTQKFKEMINDKEYKNRLELNIPRIKEKAKLNLRIVKDNI